MKHAAAWCMGILVTGLLAAATPAQAQVAGKLAQIKASRSMVIGYRPDYPPFSYALPDGSITGYGIEVCQKLVKAVENQLQTPLTVRYKPVNNKQRFGAVADGGIDLECADTTNTRQRREKYGVAFVAPYFVTGVRVLVRADSGVNTLADLRGKTLAYSAGTTSEEIAKKNANGWGANVQACGPQDTDCLRDLESRKVQAWMMDDIALQAARATSKNPQAFKTIGELMSVEHLAIMYKAGDAPYTKVLDEAMRTLMQGRQVRGIYGRWFEQPIPSAGVNLQIKPSQLLLRYMTHPSADVGEYVVY